MIYYDIVTQGGKLFIFLAYYNYDGFQHLNFIFSQRIISLFQGLFNDETNPRAIITRVYNYPKPPKLIKRSIQKKPDQNKMMS
jgi:hypothetical protein